MLPARVDTVMALALIWEMRCPIYLFFRSGRFNLQWDGAWDGRTQVVEEGWSAEFFIPWSIMPLPQAEGDRKIG